jgi:hypothetical protein
LVVLNGLELISPQTQSFSAHAPLKNKNVGLGLSILMSKIGPSDELYMNGNLFQ